MRKLYHFWLSPYCRKVRILLREKGLDCELVLEKVWERREEFLALNPAGLVPVLVEHDGRPIVESLAICEYLDEVYPNKMLIGFDPPGRAETRRLVSWFDLKFSREVSDALIFEKVLRRFMGGGTPDSRNIRLAHQNLKHHLNYIGYLAERRKWLAGDDFSLADITAAAHVSCLDYLGDVPWDDHPPAKDWYARVKSRPSFRPLLADHIPGLPPPRHYADLDF
ncbi:glutathione S-transferase family protein [Ferrovibrio sp.]|uniref:glutathione S-transferase family protein n=1 Tax=Ferrovibrio sp. TaxID=1917215 RepID=UPI0025B850D6|nr:glutathione S-transferase family protein [Ferrovibrio sp.]MBX3453383.1 glutathione S-transferase family protein [Ferrovibrio sp.]